MVRVKRSAKTESLGHAESFIEWTDYFSRRQERDVHTYVDIESDLDAKSILTTTFMVLHLLLPIVPIRRGMYATYIHALPRSFRCTCLTAAHFLLLSESPQVQVPSQFGLT